MKKIILLLLLSALNQAYSNNYFIENRGQWDSTVLYYAEGSGYAVIVTTSGILIDVPYQMLPNMFEINNSHENHTKTRMARSGEAFMLDIKDIYSKEICFKKSYKVIAEQKIDTYFNYIIGNDRNKWRTRVPAYKRLIFEDQEHINKLSLALDVELLIIEIQNDISIGINKENLLLRKSDKKYEIDFIDHRSNLAKSKKSSDDKIQRDPFNPQYLVYSSYLGAYAEPGGMDVDDEGYCYVSGYAGRWFPTTPGAYKEENNRGFLYGYISKISPDGKTLAYSTYLGGENVGSKLHRIKCDKNNNIYVSGAILTFYFDGPTLKLSDYPVTENALLKAGDTNKSFDFILTKLDSSGTKLLFSTFFGGTGDEEEDYLEVDDEGNAYIVGRTTSRDFPITPGALKDTFTPKYNNTRNSTVSKINTIAGELIYSTYFGSTAGVISNIYLDDHGCIYICGRNATWDFPTTANSFKPSIDSGKGASFISKINNTGTELVFSSFFSGGINSMDIDNEGFIYISGNMSGNMSSMDFPITTNSLGDRIESSLFLTKLSPDCSTIISSSCINNNTFDEYFYPTHIKIDDLACAWISGQTVNLVSRIVLPPTEDAFQEQGKMFFMKVNSDFTKLLYLSYIEGHNISELDLPDKIFDMSLSNNRLYLYGQTFNDEFPTTTAAFQPNKYYGDGPPAFVMKFDMTTVSVDENESNENYLFEAYPNPATSSIKLIFDQERTINKLKIINTQGITQQEINSISSSQLTLDISAYPAGLYFAVFEYADGSRQVEKFIKIGE